MQEVRFERAVPVWVRGEGGEKNRTCLFALRPEGGKYLLRLTACNFYRILVNGAFFAYGPARAAHGYARIDEYELALNTGDTLVIEVAGYRCNSFYSLNEQPFLQAELLSGGEVRYFTDADGAFVCSRLSARRQRVARFSYQRAFSESYRFSRPVQETYLGGEAAALERVAPRRLLPRRVSYPAYSREHADWRESGIFRPGKGGFDNRFLTRSALGIFPVSELETNPGEALYGASYRLTARKRELAAGDFETFAFAHAETGFLRIGARLTRDSRFLVVFDEADLREEASPETPVELCFYRNDTYNIVEYEAKAGAFLHLSFEPYTAKYVRVILLEGGMDGLQVDMVRYENADCRLPAVPDGQSRILTEAAMRTFRHNAVDLLTDCPSRERAGWLCDAWFSARAERLFTGGNQMEYNFLENYALAPELPFVPDGMVPMCYPADFSEEPAFIPNWAMWYVLELYDYRNRTGDASLIAMSRGKVEGILRYFRAFENEDGLLEDLKGWVFLEWSKASADEFICGVNYPSNMMYASALACAGALYRDAGLLEKAEKIRRTIREQSFNGQFFVDNAVRADGVLRRTDHISETCQYYAFFCGVADRDGYPDLWVRLKEQFGPRRDPGRTWPEVAPSNAFIGNYLRLILLKEAGEETRVREEAVAYFSKMAERTGTLWEHDRVCGSLDHGFASYLAVLLQENDCGLSGGRL